MEKLICAITSLAAAGYIILNLTVGNGFDAVYKLMTVTAIIFAASRAFAKAANTGDKDALFTGALGLFTLAVSEVYAFAYTFVIQITEVTLTVSDYSDACSYLFFLTSLMLLLLPPIKWESVFRIGINIASVLIIILTTYSVMANNSILLWFTVLATALLCVLLSSWLFYQTGRVQQLKTARSFACSMIFLGVWDMVVYSLLIMGAGLNWYKILASVYSPLYIWICWGLIRLRQEE